MITSERALITLPMVLPSKASADLAVDMLSPAEREDFCSLANSRPRDGFHGKSLKRVGWKYGPFLETTCIHTEESSKL